MDLRPSLERVYFSRYALPLALLAAALLLVVSELGYHRTQVVLAERDAVLARRVEVGRLQRMMIRAESSQRGYLLTGRPVYKDPYLQMLPQLEAQLGRVEAQYADEPRLLPDARRLVEIVRRKLAEMQTTVSMFQSGIQNGTGNDGGWRDLMLTDIGREAMDEIERVGGGITDEETRRLLQSNRVLDETLLWSRIGIGVMVLVALAVLMALIAQARRLAGERALRLADVSNERDRLESEVQRRTAEITEIARHLQSAREDERSRLARELHDELGGLLTAAKLDAARMRNKLGPGADAGVTERLAHLVQTLDAGIALKRRIIEDLHPSSLANLGLKPALEILCGEFAASSQIVVDTAFDEVELDKSGQLTVYRLVQEALTNTAKYAKAQHVEIGVGEEDGEVVVSVRDDGIGFDTGATPVNSHGLAGMRFRVQSARGRLQVQSTPGAGTRITAHLPT